MISESVQEIRWIWVEISLDSLRTVFLSPFRKRPHSSVLGIDKRFPISKDIFWAPGGKFRLRRWPFTQYTPGTGRSERVCEKVYIRWSVQVKNYYFVNLEQHVPQFQVIPLFPFFFLNLFQRHAFTKDAAEETPIWAIGALSKSCC